MGDGSFKAIEQLKVGDSVLSRDPASGATAVKKVLRVTVRPQVATLVLHLADGQSIETTANHPFFVSNPTPDAPAQSVAAGQLAIGNSIVTRAGPSVALTQVEWTRHSQTVYNCTVEDFHTYFVGQDALWVHNVDCDINITEEGYGHVLDEHSVGGANTADNSIFGANEDIRSLIETGEHSGSFPQRQPNGRYVRIVAAGRAIGVDRNGNPTSTYTIITLANGDLWTAYPSPPYM